MDLNTNNVTILKLRAISRPLASILLRLFQRSTETHDTTDLHAKTSEFLVQVLGIFLELWSCEDDMATEGQWWLLLNDLEQLASTATSNTTLVFADKTTDAHMDSSTTKKADGTPVSSAESADLTGCKPPEPNSRASQDTQSSQSSTGTSSTAPDKEAAKEMKHQEPITTAKKHEAVAQESVKVVASDIIANKPVTPPNTTPLPRTAPKPAASVPAERIVALSMVISNEFYGRSGRIVGPHTSLKLRDAMLWAFTKCESFGSIVEYGITASTPHPAGRAAVYSRLSKAAEAVKPVVDEILKGNFSSDSHLAQAPILLPKELSHVVHTLAAAYNTGSHLLFGAELCSLPWNTRCAAVANLLLCGAHFTFSTSQ